MKRKIAIPTFLILLSIFQGCKVSPSIKIPYVTYYKGDNTLLYFIKPMNLYNGKNKMSADFTFIDKKENDTPNVTMNYTIYDFIKTKNDAFFIQVDTTKFRLLNTEVIFEELQKGKRVIRYSSKISQKDLMLVLNKADFKFLVENKQMNRIYNISKKYTKKLRKTSNDISSIIKDKFE
jgi:hypothetical protein